VSGEGRGETVVHIIDATKLVLLLLVRLKLSDASAGKLSSDGVDR
jgi:hypothetical protein